MSDSTHNETGITHLAIIPDGNRRWARQAGIFGTPKMYDKGADRGYEVIKRAFELGVPYVSFWGGSHSNLTDRDKSQVKVLEHMYSYLANKLIEDPMIKEKGIRLSIIGQWRELLSEKTVKSLQAAIDKTAEHSNYTLTLLLGYDGERERGYALQQLLADAPAIDTWEEANKELKARAWTGNLPDADLIIRTGAWHDPHSSANFLGLISANAQYEFPQVLWPDFTAEMAEEVLSGFSERERRYGK